MGASTDAAADTQSRLEARYSEEERRQIATFYVSRPFFYHIEQVYALADLVVARAGAGSLYELASLGLPAIVIPKANLPADHQVMNARALAACGGARVLYEETTLADGKIVEHVDGTGLAAAIWDLASDSARLGDMGARSRAFVQQDALALIVGCLRGGEASADAPSSPAPVGPFRAETLPSNQALLARLERSAAEHGAAFRPDLVVRSAEDHAYFVSRASSLLASPAWEQRNLGVKLVGLLQAREKTPLLVALLRDRRKVGWPKRMLGGDYVQVGFIRRNILTSLGRLRPITPEVEAAVVEAFADPYFEARAEAARTAAVLAPELRDRAAVVAGLRRLLGDRWMEVAVAAAQALGQVGGREDALPALLALKEARYWRLRAAALEGLVSLVERGEGGDPKALMRAARHFALTSTDFKPEFRIKHLYSRLVSAIAAHEGGAE